MIVDCAQVQLQFLVLQVVATCLNDVLLGNSHKLLEHKVGDIQVHQLRFLIVGIYHYFEYLCFCP